jgi:hypothetical protein
MACILGKTTQIVRIHLMSHSINDLGAGRLYPMTVCSSSKMCINEVQKFFSSFEYKVIHIEARMFIKLDSNLYQWVPHGVEVERWLCNPRVSGSNPGNLEKVVYLDENSWTHTKS